MKSIILSCLLFLVSFATGNASPQGPLTMYLPDADKAYLVRVTSIDEGQINFSVERVLKGEAEKTLSLGGWGVIKDHWYVLVSNKRWRTDAPRSANLVGNFNEGTCGWLPYEVSQDEKKRNAYLAELKEFLTSPPAKT